MTKRSEKSFWTNVCESKADGAIGETDRTRGRRLTHMADR